MAMRGTTPGTSAYQDGRRRPLPDEPSPYRPPHLQVVADDELVVQEHRDLAPSRRSTVSSISLEPSGAEATE